MSTRYDLTRPVLQGERLPYCTECGAVIADGGVSAHDRFHAPSRRMLPWRSFWYYAGAAFIVAIGAETALQRAGAAVIWQGTAGLGAFAAVFCFGWLVLEPRRHRRESG